jgi:hypothetical protein
MIKLTLTYIYPCMIMISSLTTRNLLKTNGTNDKIIMSVFYGYMIFDMKHKKKQKKKRER